MAIAMRTTLVVQTAKNVIGRIRTSDLRTADRLKICIKRFQTACVCHAYDYALFSQS